jgi:hypothetical protein
MKRAIKIIGILVMLLGVVTACEKEDRSGVVSVRMKDHPGLASTFDEVNIEVKQIQLYYVSGPQTRGGWVKLRTQAGVYNLLKLQNGQSVGLVMRERVPVGRVTGVRLMLGENHSVVARGQRYPVKMDPEQQAGVRMSANISVKPGYFIQIMLGFDAASSIAVDAPGKFRLKPSVKVTEVLYNTQ